MEKKKKITNNNQVAPFTHSNKTKLSWSAAVPSLIQSFLLLHSIHSPSRTLEWFGLQQTNDQYLCSSLLISHAYIAHSIPQFQLTTVNHHVNRIFLLHFWLDASLVTEAKMTTQQNFEMKSTPNLGRSAKCSMCVWNWNCVYRELHINDCDLFNSL